MVPAPPGYLQLLYPPGNTTWEKRGARQEEKSARGFVSWCMGLATAAHQ